MLDHLEGRPLTSFAPALLLQMYERLMVFGGLPPADKSWEFAMQALCSPHLTSEQRDTLITMLKGQKPKPKARAGLQ